MADSVLFVPGQTNTALFAQLRAAGHSMQEILRVRDAYRLARMLFNGRYRKSERAFICHAVGVASTVATFENSVDYIIAGMFHAAYDSGQFPDGRIGKRTAGHADFLRQRVGERAEELISEAALMVLYTGRPEVLAETQIGQDKFDGLFLALAHEIDDVFDGGVLLARKYGDNPGKRLHACAKLAKAIGRKGLAELLEQYAHRISEYEWMAALKPDRLHGYTIAPNLAAYIRLRKSGLRDKDVSVLK